MVDSETKYLRDNKRIITYNDLNFELDAEFGDGKKCPDYIGINDYIFVWKKNIIRYYIISFFAV